MLSTAAADGNPFAKTVQTVSPVQALAGRVEENPFAKVEPQNFAGRFSAEGYYLHLKKAGEGFEGSLVTPEKTFKVHAAIKSGKLEGQFGDDSGAWDFSATGDGTELNFRTGSVTQKMKRRAFPAKPGMYGSAKVRVRLEKAVPDFQC